MRRLRTVVFFLALLALLLSAIPATAQGPGEIKPLITVDPPSVSVLLPVGIQQTVPLTIKNTFPQPLNWSVTFTPQVGWLSTDPATGTIPAGQSQEIKLLFNTGGLELGEHIAYLMVDSDDPETPQLGVKVYLSVVQAGLALQWLARYNGPRNSEDVALALALDSSGSVYVTGGSEGLGTGKDYTTVKYDSNGNQLWAARYNGPGNGQDVAWALALDSAGNVYVAGQSWSGYPGQGGTFNDYATVKYDPDGNQIWVARYNGSGNSDDTATAVAVDASGHIYVTGYSASAISGYDFATVKYAPDGTRLWVARYIGPDYRWDQAAAIALDAAGNVYVTGLSYGEGTGPDYATLKYDGNGNQLWVARYDGPGNAYDEAQALALDASGNVYVTGASWGWGTMFDYATLKYDPDGNQLWVSRYGVWNESDEAKAVAVDAAGNVYVTGNSVVAGYDDDYLTLKYDSNGNQLWVVRYNGPRNGFDRARAMAVDATGNIYVTGASERASMEFDYVTIKYDAAGNQLWVARFNTLGGGDDGPTALALDAAVNIYVTGSAKRDYATIKYVQAGLDIGVIPASVEQIMDPSSTATATIAILNMGDADLHWSLAEHPAVNWLSEAPASGTLAPGASQLVQVTFNSTGLAPGRYDTNLKISSDDSQEVPVQVPVTLRVREVPLQAVTGLKPGLDADGCAGGVPLILEVMNPVTGQPVVVKVGGYLAILSYPANPLQVLEVRFKPPFDTYGESNIDNPGGAALFLAINIQGAPAPIDPLAFLTLRLVGTAQDSAQATLFFDQIVDSVDGKLISQREPLPQLTFRRGDAKADGVSNIADVLFMAQYLAGLRGVGIGLDKVNPVNAASIRWDGACDKITIADVLYLAQYLVGLRDPNMNPKAPGSPPPR